jgi:hypothetical protein
MDGIDRILRSPPRLDQLIRPRFGNLPVALRRSRSCRERGLYLRRSEREGEAGPFSHEGAENVAIERGFLGVQVSEDGIRPIRPGNRRRLRRHHWGHHRVRDACGVRNRKCLLIKLIQSMNPHVFGLFFPAPLERPNE